MAHGGEGTAAAPRWGTGLRGASDLLSGAPFCGTIALTHLHWDQVQGLPFSATGDRPDARVRLVLPDDGTDDAAALLARVMSPPLFPVTPAGLRGEWSCEALVEGDHDVEGFALSVREIPHKGRRTLGFRLTNGAATFVFLPDHGRFECGDAVDPLPCRDAALALARGADLLVHDAQHTLVELPEVAHYGHATIDDAIELGVALPTVRLRPARRRE